MTVKKGKDKILIVDDQPEDIWPLSQHLQPGFDVLCVTSGKEALEIAFSENRPDLIMLDIMMPDMDGYEVCEKLKSDASTREIPIIFLTGKTADPEQVKGLGLGAQDYVTKPFSLPVVMARVKSVLNLKKEMNRRLLLKAQLEALNLQLEHQVRQKQRELEAAREALKQYEDKWSRLFKEEGAAKAPKHILVVDDNPENVHILANNLQSQHEVICTTSGKEALEIAFSDDRPDIILLDIMMPDMDGFEVCSRLKANAETWSIPVIFITALGQEVDETRGLNLGAVDFITKPFSIPVARARIEAHLRLKEEMDSRITLARKLEELNKNLEARIQKKAVALEQAHEELKTSESKYRGIYENAIEGIFQTTPEGRFLDASPSLARSLGYDSPGELVATVTDAAHQPFLRPQDQKIVWQALDQKGELFGFETQFKKKNGEVVWVMISAKAVRDKNDELHYFQGFVVDITERKRAEEEIRRLNQELEQRVVDRTVQLEAANKELEAFSFSVSHDLRAPLRHIVGFLELLQKKSAVALDEQGQHYMDVISESTRKMGQLIEDLLSFSRMGRQALSRQAVDLKTLVGEVIDELGPEAAGRTISWHVGDLPMVTGDRALLRIVLVNLISNALKFTRPREQAEIEIGCTPGRKNETFVFVRDNGVGFDMNYADKLFGVFQRLHQADEFEGTGIGLATVRRIIARHGGRTWAEGKPDHGAAFYFALPHTLQGGGDETL
ncbi:MAG: response regulator [Desulfobacteraceae bacterium]|jgi:PAS domain S-box-containing protein